jgi:hypothetical protein
MSKNYTIVVHLEFLINISTSYFTIYKKKIGGMTVGVLAG